MRKVTKLLGLDKLAKAAKVDLEQVKSGNAPALTAEKQASEQSKKVKEIVAEGRDKIGGVK